MTHWFRRRDPEIDRMKDRQVQEAEATAHELTRRERVLSRDINIVRREAAIIGNRIADDQFPFGPRRGAEPWGDST